MKQVGGIEAAPAIEILKTCDEFVLEGGTITYKIIITNTGNETLEDITVEDTILGDLSDDFVDTLAPGDSDSATVEHETTGPADVHNVVTVEANGVISSTGVDATDDCDTRMLNPDILVEKTCTDFAQVGDEITYTITVTNTGDEDLENIVVEDTVLGDRLGLASPDTLAAGAFGVASSSPTRSTVKPGPAAELGDRHRLGRGSLEEVVDSTANCSTDILNPDILVEKTCPDFAQVGDTITYTITVTNTGDEDLENIVVEDSLLGDPLGSSPTPGGRMTRSRTSSPTTVTENSPDPVPNEVTATGSGVNSEEPWTSTANCSTDMLQPGHPGREDLHGLRAGR